MTSIFTKIIQWEIPCTKIYEDELCFAFLDINPVTKGHTLVIPKQEIERIWQIPDDLLAHMMYISKKLMKQMINNLWVDYVQLTIEWLEVPHAHIHLIPNMKENHIVSYTHTAYQDNEAQDIANKIKI